MRLVVTAAGGRHPAGVEALTEDEMVQVGLARQLRDEDEDEDECSVLDASTRNLKRGAAMRIAPHRLPTAT
ncbi:hypothetical protein ACFQ7M_36175 [Streptomyces massasporeus]